jgi:hypothetical protein
MSRRAAWVVWLWLVGGGDAFGQGPAAPPCAAANLAGRFFVSAPDGRSWTLLLEPGCGYSSLRFTGDHENDLQQPIRGVAKLAQVDNREVLILQSAQGEFDEVMSVVRQGPRVYLVPTNEHLRFCLEWARGIEPRKGPIGRFLLRGGGETSVVPREIPALCREGR